MQYFDNIELYLDGELGQAEKANFERQLSSDVVLQRAVAEEKATRATLYLMMTEGFRQRAVAEEKSDKNEAKIVTMQPRRNWHRYAIAAATIGVVLMTTFFLNQRKSVDYTALSEKYTYDFPVPKVQDDSAEKQVSDAFYSAIKGQKYDLALKTFEQLPMGMQDNEELLFYKAFCLLKNKKFQEAQREFLRVAVANPNPNPTMKESIEWYLLMAKLGEQKDIKADLETIAKDENHSYQAKAKALLEEMK